ncbi:MAG: hypothetical protein LLG42_13150, partial [Chloroflexi bacterium]|nr:hypothetical protein [Chloroflexota bacterium]
TSTITSTSLPPTETPTPLPTDTSIPTPTKTKTITPTPTLFTDTRMGALVQSLYDDEIIHSTKGTYHLLDDFDESWAQIEWYQWYLTDFQPENFIIRVDATWESASQTANWDNSGCGFVFSASDENNHHAVFLTMDGYVRPHKYQHNVYTELQSGYYGQFDIPKDSAEIILIVENKFLTVMVNREVVVQFDDASLQKGGLGLSLASGTNKDFGTRCEMRNIDYWGIQ